MVAVTRHRVLSFTVHDIYWKYARLYSLTAKINHNRQISNVVGNSG